MDASLVYSDERLVVINKPPGVSLATTRAAPHDAARRLVFSLPAETRAANFPGSAPLWLVHRLDVGTTGLVLLARDEEMHRELSTLFSTRLVRKIYLALVWGHPRPRSGRFEWPLAPDTRDRRRMRVDPSGRSAATSFRTLACGPHVSLLELQPATGRTHQLRVHLSHAGHWIVGDDLYGGARHRGVKEPDLQSLLNPPHLLLHAWRILLPESSNIMPKRFEAALPPHFAAVLESMGMLSALVKFEIRDSKFDIRD